MTKIIFIAEGPWLGLQNGASAKIAEHLQTLKPFLIEAQGIISASVKWRPKGKFLAHKNATPPLMGDNAPNYKIHGQLELADAVAKAAEATGIWAETTEEWGLDPGHWLPLSILNPEGILPVLPLSLSQMSPEAHRKWGVAVRRATQKSPEAMVLIITGALSSRKDLSDLRDTSLRQVEQFDREILKILKSGALGELDNMDRNLFKAAQPEGGWGSLYFLWGALGENIPGTLHYYERRSAGVGSAAFQFNC